MIKINILFFFFLGFCSQAFCCDFEDPFFPNYLGYSHHTVLNSPTENNKENSIQGTEQVEEALRILMRKLPIGTYLLENHDDRITCLPVCSQVNNLTGAEPSKNLESEPFVESQKYSYFPEDPLMLVEKTDQTLIPHEISPPPKKETTKKTLKTPQKKTFLDLSDKEKDEFYTICINYKKDWKKVQERIYKIFKLKKSVKAIKLECKSMEDNKSKFLKRNTRFTEEEDSKILEGIKEHGFDWMEINKKIPSRPPISIKNRYYSMLRKSKGFDASAFREEPEKSHSILTQKSEDSEWNPLD